jgi:hypothetical protein
MTSHADPKTAGASRLPPLRTRDAQEATRLARDASIRSVESIDTMRAAIRQHAAQLPPFTQVPRYKRLDAAAFRKHAMAGMPFLIDGVVDRWPLIALPPETLRERYGALPVRARVGDYVGTAFAPDRAMADMTMGQYLDLVESEATALPPYIGNLGLRELNRLCHWPTYFDKMGPPRFWIGPARTVTPLHCDFDDNIFAQIWGRKRIFLAPPHHGAQLYAREASPLLFASPVDPEAPDFDKFPLARDASLVEIIVEPGDMLYVPAGWFHQVRALTFSLSSNRWARGVPLALQGTVARG